MNVKKAPPETPLWAPPKETTLRYGIGMTRLYALIRDGRVTARKIGKKTLIEQASVAAVIEAGPRVGEARQ